MNNKKRILSNNNNNINNDDNISINNENNKKRRKLNDNNENNNENNENNENNKNNKNNENNENNKNNKNNDENIIEINTQLNNNNDNINDPNSSFLSNPAKIYPFVLDTFQKDSISYIENNESVLVSAHTSAGKTVVAEYAIAKSLRDKQRVIYTSPIKALSNQKYRDLEKEFHDVGLMTGDITINPNATCLIMTTEILRNMLYRGSEIMREVKWVIYDEIHYMRDRERGIVWEESIILLPHNVRFVFLSATIPNANEFVNWITKIHHQPCHVVYTDYRPTPLQHYLFPAGSEGLYQVVNEEGIFKEENFQKAMSTLRTDYEETILGDNKKKQNRNSIEKQKKEDLDRIIQLIIDKEYDPVIVFSFSKKECELNAIRLANSDFNDDEEKDLVQQVYENATYILSSDDQTLPQVEKLLPLLKRGIGIHHGGLLPILKEIIEILFQEGLIKCLFATETFSIGINMPAKTVVFTSTRKFDGKDFRWITSGEYIQMSGRAGRRGIDKRGIVIQMIDEKMEPAIVKNMIYGKADPLNSSYHISYNMLLNMLRVEDAEPEFMMRSSFHQYQQEMKKPKLEEKLNELIIKRNNISIENEDEISEYYILKKQLSNAMDIKAKIIHNPLYILQFLAKGRMVYIKINNKEFGWATIIKYSKIEINHKRNNNDNDNDDNDDNDDDDNDDNNDNNDNNIDSNNDNKNDNEENKLNNNKIIDEFEEKIKEKKKKLKSRKFNIKENEKTEEFVIHILLNLKKKKEINLNLDENDNEEIKNDNNNDDNNDNNNNNNNNSNNNNNDNGIEPCSLDDENGEPAIIEVPLKSILKITAVKLRVPNDLLPTKNRKTIIRSMREAIRRINPLPELDPINDMKINENDINPILSWIDELNNDINKQPILKILNNNENKLNELLNLYHEKYLLNKEIKYYKNEIKKTQLLILSMDLKKMKNVLEKLGYINEEGIIQLKGRIASEINTSDELLTTELMFNGIFNDITPSQLAGLLSCLIFNERSNGTPIIRGELKSLYQQLQESAKEIGKTIDSTQLPINVEKYIDSFNPEIMEACYEWCNGKKFIEICKLTKVFEGSLIRSIRRLEELLRQLTSAAFAIGNMKLKTKFDETATLIRRDIVFTSSLYLN